jgi:phage repressor protein C with HTH and peptisase S24 domain
MHGATLLQYFRDIGVCTCADACMGLDTRESAHGRASVAADEQDSSSVAKASAEKQRNSTRDRAQQSNAYKIRALTDQEHSWPEPAPCPGHFSSAQATTWRSGVARWKRLSQRDRTSNRFFINVSGSSMNSLLQNQRSLIIASNLD